MRLDKLFSTQGICSRSEIKKEIKAGLVFVNGLPVLNSDIKVDPLVDVIEYKGKRIGYEEYVYIMLNKPAGVVTAREDGLSRTVMDVIHDTKNYVNNTSEELISFPRELSPVGRLDKDTEGLLVITNDGDYNHSIMSPRSHVSKKYFARVRGRITEEQVKLFSEGLDIGDDKPTRPALLEILEDALVQEGVEEGEESVICSEVYITISEGRYHQVKRMFEAVGSKVLFLKRVAIGGLELDKTLEPGQYRKMTKQELQLSKEK